MVALKQEISSLKIKIINAFSDVEFPGNDKILYVEDYDDDSEILDFYGLDDWQSIPDDIIEYNNDSLLSFSPEAFQFYLPSFLFYVLDNYDSDEIVVPNTIYSLAPLYECDFKATEKFLSNHGHELEPQLKKDMEDAVAAFKERKKGQEEDDLRDYSISQFKHLTRNQKKGIVSFLELIRDHFLEDMEEKAVKSALDYWHNEIK